MGCYRVLLSVTFCYFGSCSCVFRACALGGREGLGDKETHEEGTRRQVFLFFSVPCRPHPPDYPRRPFPVRRKPISLGLLTPICPQGGEQEASLFSVRGKPYSSCCCAASLAKQYFLTHSCSHPFVCVCVCACVRVGVDFLHGDAQRGHGGRVFAYRICQFRILGNNC